MASKDPQQRQDIGRLAARARWRPADPETQDALREARAASLATYIQKTVDLAPPLTPDQRDRLALLLRGGEANDAA